MEDLSRQADSETCRIESQTGREDKKMVNRCALAFNENMETYMSGIDMRLGRRKVVRP